MIQFVFCPDQYSIQGEGCIGSCGVRRFGGVCFYSLTTVSLLLSLSHTARYHLDASCSMDINREKEPLESEVNITHPLLRLRTRWRELRASTSRECNSRMCRLPRFGCATSFFSISIFDLRSFQRALNIQLSSRRKMSFSQIQGSWGAPPFCDTIPFWRSMDQKGSAIPISPTYLFVTSKYFEVLVCFVVLCECGHQ
jgi:hypothetical protein